jgi:hypothetical protein
MILLLMRDDKVDDQRALFFAFMSFFFTYIYFFTLSASKCLQDGQRFTFNLGSWLMIEHFGGRSVPH